MVNFAAVVTLLRYTDVTVSDEIKYAQREYTVLTHKISFHATEIGFG